MRTLQDIELDIQSQDEAVVGSALEELRDHDLGHLDGRHSQTLMTLCSKRMLSPSIKMRAAALWVILQIVRHGQYIPVGGLSSSQQRAASNHSTRSRKIGSQTEILAKKLQTAALLDLSAGAEQEDFAKCHQNLCALITELQEQSPKKFLPGFKPIGQYLVKCTGHPDRAVATAASEYWAKLKVPPVSGKAMDHWVPSVLSQLQRLVPALLHNMVFHEEQVTFLEAGNLGENATPRIEELSNLRNYSALGFEKLCQIFQNEISAIFKPLVYGRLLHNESASWQETEATLLALSAFIQAVGLPRDMVKQQVKLHKKLLELYAHERPLVRAIACFAMQQLIGQPLKNAKDPYPEVLKANMRLLTDEYPEVQVMAVRSLSSMLAMNGRDLTPYKKKLINRFLEASNTLEGDASLALYESIGYLFHQMGPTMEESEVERILEPVLQHWDKMALAEVSADDIIAICQPMCVIAMHSGKGFETHNVPVLHKVCDFLQSVCTNGARSSHTPEDLTTKLVSIIDLISSIYEGQGSGAKASVLECKVPQMCIRLLEAKELDCSVHQAVFAVLGHVGRHDYNALSPHVPSLLLAISRCVQRGNDVSLKNNALWALAQIAEKEKTQRDDLFKLTSNLLEVIEDVEGDQGCVINAALALTNLCTSWPDHTAKVLGKVFPYICALLQVQFPRDLERDALFKNLCVMLQPNLDRMQANCWHLFCIAAATLSTSDRELVEVLTEFMHTLRAHLGTKGWNTVSQQVGAQVAIVLRKRYKLY